MGRPSTRSQARRIHKLRDALLDAQFELRHSKAGSVIMIVAGVPAAGRSETVRELLDGMDQKYISVRAHGAPDRHERRHPWMWRYWQVLPPQGRLAFFFDGWYSEFLHATKMSKSRRERAAERIRALESMLRADGIAIVKVYMRLDAKLQRERLKRLRADKLTRWRVTREDRLLAKRHKQIDEQAQTCIQATNHDAAPWLIVDGAQEEGRLLAVGNALLEGMHRAQQRASEARVEQERTSKVSRTAALPSRAARRLTDAEYEKSLLEQQGRFALLARRKQFRKRALVLAFEGMDAAGKGGAIQRLTHALDVRQYQVVPVSAPTPQELAFPYLWRFWRHVPELGAISIFDRSWYGRVLVERVRGFAGEADWRRAYGEINEFELQLAERGIVVQKFWLSVSKAEQLRRFEKRDENPLKRFKVDPEDWKNHRFYDAYQQAAKEMIEKTSTPHAPWIVVESDDKRFARIKILQHVCEHIERELDGAGAG